MYVNYIYDLYYSVGELLRLSKVKPTPNSSSNSSNQIWFLLAPKTHDAVVV